jgi:putative molybdopterin biosynthesis protein
VGSERVPVSEAHNRVLAEDVVAPIDVPPFHRSTVDGYAVRAVNTFGADEDQPITLKLCGRVSVGETTSIVVKDGTTAEIVTGAPVPQGADAVVMLEYAVQEGDNVLIYRPVAMGENVMRAGSDIRKGETILKRGQTLSSREIGVLAALGCTRVEVYQRPRVAVISTGAEIAEPGKSLPPGKIYDINAYTLSAAVSECGGKPVNLGIVPDDVDQLKAVFREALDSADMVVTSGGVSVGPSDVIPQVLNQLGKPGVIVCGLALKPGKPTTIAMIDGKPVFSLPGHPTSSLLMFYQFVRPLIRDMAGRPGEAPFKVKATTTEKMFAARGRRTFVMVKLTRDKSGRLLASPVPLGLSGAITTLAKADGFVEIHESQQFISIGDEVTVHLFKPLYATVSME